MEALLLPPRVRRKFFLLYLFSNRRKTRNEAVKIGSSVSESHFFSRQEWVGGREEEEEQSGGRKRDFCLRRKTKLPIYVLVVLLLEEKKKRGYFFCGKPVVGELF